MKPVASALVLAKYPTYLGLKRFRFAVGAISRWLASMLR